MLYNGKSNLKLCRITLKDKDQKNFDMVILYIQYKYTMQERSMQERNIEGFYDDYFLTPKGKRQKREEMYVQTKYI